MECSAISLQSLSHTQGEQPQMLKLEGRIHGPCVCVLVHSAVTQLYLTKYNGANKVEEEGYEKHAHLDGGTKTRGICRNLVMELGSLCCCMLF